MSWGFSVIISRKRNERLQSQLRNCQGGALPPHDCTLSCSHRAPTHDTKPEALLFIVRIGRSTLSWMGRIRYAPLWDERRSPQELGPLLLFWRRPADVNNDGGPKMAVQVRNSTKCHLGQHSPKSKESWLENILNVFVCRREHTNTLGTIRALCAAGLWPPLTWSSVSFSSNGQAFSLLQPASHSPLYISPSGMFPGRSKRTRKSTTMDMP